MRILVTYPTVLILTGYGTLFLGAADWPQWRGPQRNGISSETGLLQSWPAEGPRLEWQATGIGSGHAAPAVVGDRIYLLANDGLEREFVQALSTTDGRRLWTAPLGKVGNPDQNPKFPAARSTPTVDGPLLYALGSDGDLACVEIGRFLWRYGRAVSRYGANIPSPVAHQGLIYCAAAGTGGGTVRLRATNGGVEAEELYFGPKMPTAIGGAVIIGEHLYGTTAQTLLCIELATGEILWDERALGAAALCVADDRLYWDRTLAHYWKSRAPEPDAAVAPVLLRYPRHRILAAGHVPVRRKLLPIGGESCGAKWVRRSLTLPWATNANG